MKIDGDGYKQLPTERRATVYMIVESCGVSINDVTEIRTTPLTISFTVLLRKDGQAYIEEDDLATDIVCKPLPYSDWISLKKALV